MPWLEPVSGHLPLAFSERLVYMGQRRKLLWAPLYTQPLCQLLGRLIPLLVSSKALVSQDPLNLHSYSLFRQRP